MPTQNTYLWCRVQKYGMGVEMCIYLLRNVGFAVRFGNVRSLPNVLAIVLAGGEGKRLFPLTEDRAKPAVPFGGSYRLIDFVLSNLVNAGYLKIAVLTQYKSCLLYTSDAADE